MKLKDRQRIARKFVRGKNSCLFGLFNGCKSLGGWPTMIQRIGNREASETKRADNLVPGTLLLAILVMLLGLPTTAHAGGGPLDPSFGEGGVVITPTPSTRWNGIVLGLVEDSKGRLVAAGETNSGNFGLLRYFADGSLDRSFRGGGFLERDPSYPGGLVETAFGDESAAQDVAIQQNGMIVAAGSVGMGSFASFALARYEEDGARDPSFGKDGRVTTHLGQDDGGAFAMAIQRDGRILVGGFRETRHRRTEGLLIRYLPDGGIDRGLGSHGEVRFATRGKGQASVHDLVVLPGGKILLAGGFHGRFMLARLLPDGSPDRGFGGGDGRVLTDVDGGAYCSSGVCAYATSLAVGHGQITLAGNAGDRRSALFAVLTRYRANGKLERGFGEGGIVRARRGLVLTAEQMAIQKDGRILLAGKYLRKGYRIAALRFLPNGEPDPSFGNAGFFTRRIGYSSKAFAALAQRDGKVVIGGFAKQELFPGEAEPEIEFPLENAHFTLMRFLP